MPNHCVALVSAFIWMAYEWQQPTRYRARHFLLATARAHAANCTRCHGANLIIGRHFDATSADATADHGWH